MAIDLDNTPEELTEIQKALGLDACVIVRKSSTAAAERYFAAQENTDAGRMAILASAIATVAAGDVVELVKGVFAVAAGEPLSSFTEVTGWTVVCRDGAAHVYEDENDAAVDGDALIFSGTVRRAEHFGYKTGLGAGVDMQPVIQAALFSGVGTTNQIVAPVDYPDIIERKTQVLLPDGAAYIADTIYMTGFQQLLSAGARRSQLIAVNNFDNGTDEKFMVEVCQDTVIGSPASNFHFLVRVNVDLLTNGANNAKTSLLYFSSGQGGSIRIGGGHLVSGFRGVVIRGYSSYFDIPELDLNGCPAQTGPLLEFEEGCHGYHVGTITLQKLNNFTAASGNRKTYVIDGTSGNLPALAMFGNYQGTFDNISGEQVGTLSRMQECRNMHIGQMGAAGSGVISCGEIMADFFDCSNLYVGGFSGIYFEKLYRFQRFGQYKEWVSNNDLDYAPGLQSDPKIVSLEASELRFGRTGNDSPAFAYFVITNEDTPSVPGMYFRDSGGFTYGYLNRGTHTGPGGGTILDTTGYSWVIENGLFSKKAIKTAEGYGVIAAALDPTVSDIPAGMRQTWRNTVSGEIRDWTNVGGTLYKSAAYTT